MRDQNRRPAGISLGRALTILPGIANDDLREVVAILDRVHGDGRLPAIPLAFVETRTDPSGNSLDGTFAFEVDDHGRILGRAILVRFAAPHRRFVALHEVGHFLDACGLPGGGESSRYHPLLTPWREAIFASRAFRELIQLVASSDPPTTSRAVKLLDSVELWSRSYAQFIAIRSGDGSLVAALNALRRRSPNDVYFPRQWPDDDFVGIEAAIEQLFWSLGWIA